MSAFSIYIHIPYCLHKCPYCDFNTYALANIPEREYLSALLSELDYRASLAAWRGRTVQSIYFGGGTPSLFQTRSIARIVSFICRSFPVDDKLEVSIEANPGTVDPENLAGFRESGVNRLSLGAQSFNRDTLKLLGRMHSPEQVEAAVASARAVGFSNINLDLIFSVPRQNLDLWKTDLMQALALEPEHLSCYGLTIEKGTPFYQSFKRGVFRLLSEELSAEMLELAMTLLPANSFQHYEISNFAREGFEARHNLAYWNGSDYLGIGAGAHSYLACYPALADNYGMRWSNFALPEKYMTASVANGSAEAWNDTLKRKDAIFEFFFLGLRKICGVSLFEFEKRFDLKFEQAYGPVLEMLKDQSLISINQDSLSLTQEGIMLADSVIEQFSDPQTQIVSAPIAQGA